MQASATVSCDTAKTSVSARPPCGAAGARAPSLKLLRLAELAEGRLRLGAEEARINSRLASKGGFQGLEVFRSPPVQVLGPRLAVISRP